MSTSAQGDFVMIDFGIVIRSADFKGIVSRKICYAFIGTVGKLKLFLAFFA
jgi:hypothetical protein